jgi:hypothetical protein
VNRSKRSKKGGEGRVTSEMEGIDDIPGGVFHHSTFSGRDGEIATLEIIKHSNSRQSHKSTVLEIELGHDGSGGQGRGGRGKGSQGQGKKHSSLGIKSFLFWP